MSLYPRKYSSGLFTGAMPAPRPVSKSKPKSKPIPKPVLPPEPSPASSAPPAPTGHIPKDVLDALARIETKVDDLIKKDAEVHKKIDEPKSNLEEIKAEAKRISKEEGVVQHVNRVSDGVYKIDNFYDADTTEVSYENGLQK